MSVASYMVHGRACPERSRRNQRVKVTFGAATMVYAGAIYENPEAWLRGNAQSGAFHVGGKDDPYRNPRLPPPPLLRELLELLRELLLELLRLKLELRLEPLLELQLLRDELPL